MNHKEKSHMQPFLARQGDVLITRVPEIPSGLNPVKRDNGRVVLAYGEVTGHAHAIVDDPVTLFAPADLDEMTDRFLQVEQEAQLTHEEHDTITLPPGSYLVRRQREYTPSTPMPVAD